MKALPGLLLFFILNIPVAYCQQVVLEGVAEQFAGENLLIRKISNPITGESIATDTLFIDSKGSFHKDLCQNKSGWIFINTGVFRITMFIRPGYAYEISLPPKTKKSEADIRNPFYKPIQANIIVLKEYPIDNKQAAISGTDINSRIFSFDTLIVSKNSEMMEARRTKRFFDADSIISLVEELYKTDTSRYFREYRNFRYGIIKINSFDAGLQEIYEHYLRTATPRIDDPAYMELFNEMYKEFLFYFSRTPDGKSINYLINRVSDLDALKDTLMKHPAVPDRRMAELIILKEIYNIYFKDYFYREALLIILNQVIENPETEEHSALARGIKKYLTRLKTGSKPPPFELTDRKGRKSTLEDYRGKYIYLNFCTPDNYSCLKEFPFLNVLYKTHNNYLEIVTVMVTENFESMNEFMKKNRYDWTALFYGNDENLLLDYDVKAFPTCYLMDPEGKIVQSPAALATEGLEQQLFRIMKSRGDL